ncbi:MAG: C39 family peptidase [FCB group bacterium]|jgi:hypothetical protein|nr:C39 family peptidase [FCB group bacterium]
MDTRLELNILPQPDETTCGPTCLHAVYDYYGDAITLDEVVRQAPCLEGGGTLDVFLANHALSRGYRATIYTYNLRVFDPTWFAPGAPDLRDRLRAQLEHKKSPKLRVATNGYLEFLTLGGRLRFEDLNPYLIRKYLNQGVPILTGLSSTYLHRTSREHGDNCESDDLRGDPAGHFVVLCGYDRATRQVLVADPLYPNPLAHHHRYYARIDRVICAILLGIVTYDANLLIIEPAARRKGAHNDKSDSSQ